MISGLDVRPGTCDKRVLAIHKQLLHRHILPALIIFLVDEFWSMIFFVQRRSFTFVILARTFGASIFSFGR